MIEFLAKSEQYGRESIEKHTLNVIKNYKTIKDYIKYDKFNNNFWELAKIACLLHDLGKHNDKFQKKVMTGSYVIEGEIPHSFLSTAYIPEYIEDESDFFPLFYSIAYHHERKINFNENEFISTVQNDLETKVDYLEWLNKENLNIKSTDPQGLFDYFSKNTQQYLNLIDPINKEEYQKFIFLKGLLHKCDYSASAHLTPEKNFRGNYQKDFEYWLFCQDNGKDDNKGWKLKEFQKDAKRLSEANKSVVLVASTGVGKTEYSMNWINGNKAFYLLGLRMATNKMYERFRNVFNCHGRENVTLLHSSAGNILMDESDDIFSYFNKSKEGRQLSYPITIATADQLVTSVFKYPGFELKYFTASYSSIVVDEIQSFAPEAIASIVVFLTEIHKLGGRFLLMTATLPSFVKGDLENLTDIEFPEHQDQLSSKKRHKIEFVEEGIENTVLDYTKEDKKTLILCNTVKKAQEVASLLKDNGLNPKLLHSKFIAKDRRQKEDEIMNDAPNGKKGKQAVIWIATQIVEASLDLDFDLLITENATVDSLFQRFGRCYRNREYHRDEPNIIITKESDNSSYIYDKDIMKRTWNILFKYNQQLLSEVNKQDIINEVFEETAIKNSEYIKKYDAYKKLLGLGFRAKNTSEAQNLFRKITNQYTVIPKPIYEQNSEYIDALLQVLDSKSSNKDLKIDESKKYWNERLKVENELMGFTIGVQLYKKEANEKIKKEYFSHSKFCEQKNIYVVDGCQYSYENGLILVDDTEDFNDYII